MKKFIILILLIIIGIAVAIIFGVIGLNDVTNFATEAWSKSDAQRTWVWGILTGAGISLSAIMIIVLIILLLKKK